jgi:hypothetical protein
MKNPNLIRTKKSTLHPSTLPKRKIPKENTKDLNDRKNKKQHHRLRQTRKSNCMEKRINSKATRQLRKNKVLSR